MNKSKKTIQTMFKVVSNFDKAKYKTQAFFNRLLGKTDGQEFDQVIWGKLIDLMVTSHNYKQSCYNPASCVRECYFNLMTNREQINALAQLTLDDLDSDLSIMTQATTPDKPQTDPLEILSYLDNQSLSKTKLSDASKYRLALSLFNNKVQSLMWQKTNHYFTKFAIECNVVKGLLGANPTNDMYFWDFDNRELMIPTISIDCDDILEYDQVADEWVLASTVVKINELQLIEYGVIL